MSFPSYPAYRQTAEGWFEQIPQHWGIGSLRWLCRRYAGGTPDRSKEEFWEGGTVPWLNSGAVNDRLIMQASEFITEAGLAASSARWIPEKSLVMALAGQGKTKGMVAQLAIASTCNQSMAAIVPDARLAPRFLFWWLDCNYQNIRNLAGGDLRDGLNLELIGNICCPLPSISEQDLIAAFLDRETSKIDALVTEQRRLMELLKEKRQAGISHAVNRGLNPGVPMKNSGVEWLGEIPAHWQLGALTRFVEPVVDYRGRTPTKQETGLFLVTARNVRAGRIDYEASEEYVDPESAASLLERGAPEIGDLLFTMEAPLGQVALIDRTDIALAQRIVKFRGRKEIVDNEFLMYWIIGGYCQAQLETLATGSTALGIKASKLGMIDCLVPPLEEQRRLVVFLRAYTEKIDSLISESRDAVALLLERRAALISAAVTGQIDVRGLVDKVAA